MAIRLVSRTQVQMLADSFLAPAPDADPLPPDLQPPLRTFTPEQIRPGLPSPGPFTRADLQCTC